jgi:hypothetical protein
LYTFENLELIVNVANQHVVAVNMSSAVVVKLAVKVAFAVLVNSAVKPLNASGQSNVKRSTHSWSTI